MLRFAMRGKPIGVGCEEGEGRLLVLAIDGQVEVHAPDDVPHRIQSFEEVLNAIPGFAQLDGESRTDFAPECAQYVRRQILGTRHHRSGEGERGKIFLGRGQQLRAPLRRVWSGAQRRDVAAAELPPPGEDRRQNLPDLSGPESQQSMARPTGECLFDPLDERRIQFGDVFRGSKDEVPVRCQTG